GSSETGRRRQAFFQPMADRCAVELAADQHQPVLSRTGPGAFIQRKPAADEMKDEAALAFGEPENALAAEHRGRELLVEEVLELLKREGPVAQEGDRGEAVIRQMIMAVMIPVVM